MEGREERKERLWWGRIKEVNKEKRKGGTGEGGHQGKQRGLVPSILYLTHRIIKKYYDVTVYALRFWGSLLTARVAELWNEFTCFDPRFYAFNYAN